MFAGLFKRSQSETAASAGSDEITNSFLDDIRETDEGMANFDDFSQEQSIDTQATAVGAETTIQGDLDVKGQLNIYGVIEGQVRCDSEIYIGETGRINGDVLAMNIRVAGYLDGVLECGQLTILNSGKVSGEAATDSFMIEEGVPADAFLDTHRDYTLGEVLETLEEKGFAYTEAEEELIHYNGRAIRNGEIQPIRWEDTGFKKVDRQYIYFTERLKAFYRE